MRAIFKLALILAAAASAQEPEGGYARLRFVNATGMEGAVLVSLDGQKLNSRGYTSGQATGHMDVLPKNYQIELKHDTLGESRLNLELRPGEMRAVIVLAKIGETKKEGEPPEITLDHHLLEYTVLEKGSPSSLLVLQTTPLPSLEISVAGKSCTAERFKPASMVVTGDMGQFPVVHFQQRRVCSLSFHEPADAALILYADAKGTLQHIFFKNHVR
ncbi:MAG TPA: hypothetical protein DIT13_02085 [Verrucomicrobiales bacterium]|nr:hypothetical protein [Verrucomicrobiales bacterium]HRJ10580.1 hypothetical protein [Prosthecobacter sp.]HRK16715.1 hypothetical protein [Prosthecobacter sp.]